jgi:hypothetical protein
VLSSNGVVGWGEAAKKESADDWELSSRSCQIGILSLWMVGISKRVMAHRGEEPNSMVWLTEEPDDVVVAWEESSAGRGVGAEVPLLKPHIVYLVGCSGCAF